MIKTIRIVAFLGALIFVAFMALDHDPEFDLRIGWNAFRAGDMDSSLRLASLVCLLAPSDSKEWASARELQARAALKLNRPDKARDFLETLLKAKPNHPGGLRMRGELKLLAGDAAGALVDLKQSQKDLNQGTGKPHRSQASSIARRGQAFLEVGDLAAAIKDAKTAYELNPGDAQVLYTVSLVLEKQGHFLPALEYMEKAAKTANRKDQTFMRSEEGKKWIHRLIVLRGKAGVPKSRPYFPEDN